MSRVDPKWRPLNIRVINIWHVLTIHLFTYTFNKYSPRVYYVLPVGKQPRLKQKEKKNLRRHACSRGDDMVLCGVWGEVQ